MAIEIYLSDDTTLVEDLAFTGPGPGGKVQAGADSDEIELHVWNDQGNPGGQARRNVALVFQVEHPSTPDVFVSTGFPPVDELWGRAKIIDYDNAAAPTWTVPASDWQSMGAYALLLLGDVPPDCAVFLKLKLHPPSYSNPNAWRFGLSANVDEYSRPLPPSLSLLDRGILVGIGDGARSGLIRGGETTATGTPDDEVHVAAADWERAGVRLGKIVTDHTLNQNDGAVAALATGESYLALLTLGASGVTVTKGLKGASPASPAAPAGEPLLARVTVDFDAGGTSVIGADDVEDLRLFDRFAAVAGAGLNLVLHSGQALGGYTHRYQSGKQEVALSPSDTFYLYQLESGLWAAATVEERPTTGSLGPWWEADTDGSAVIDLRDRRTYAGRSIDLALAGALPGSPGFIADLVVETEELWIDDVTCRVSDNGGGASGSTVFDVQLNGATIFTSFAVESWRPTFNFDASVLSGRGYVAEVRRLRRGDVVSFHSITHPSGGTPARAEVHLICRMP